MNTPVTQKLDFRKFALLDAISTILLGLGLANLAADIHVIPESLRFEHYGIAFIISGVLLSIPTLHYVLTQIRQRKPG